MNVSSQARTAVLLFLVGLMAAGCMPAADSPDGGEYASHGKPGDSPAQVYLRYIKVLKEAKSVEDLFPFSPFPAAQNRADLARMPAADRMRTLAVIKVVSLDPTGARVLAETVNGDVATLEVHGVAPDMNGQLEETWGTVTLVRRGGEWKISAQELRDHEKTARKDD